MLTRPPPPALTAALFMGLSACVMLDPDDRAAHTDADADGAASDVDCDDQDPDTFPGATERCNARDDDCDGQIDEGLRPDADADGFGDDTEPTGACFVSWVATRGDCDDQAPDVHPGQEERCDGLNNGCLDDWDPTHELGMVTWTSPNATEWADHTDAFAAGTDGAPALPPLPETGTLTLCRAAQDHYVRLVSSRVSDLTLTGLAIPLTTDASIDDSVPTLNGINSTGAAGATIDLTGDGWSLTVQSLRIQGGVTGDSRWGGGLHLQGAHDVTIDDTVIAANRALDGQDGAAGLGLEDVDSAIIRDSQFLSNAAGTHSLGGALHIRQSNVQIINTVFDSNLTRSYGGAIYVHSGELAATNVRFVDNEGTDGGGAIYVASDGRVDLVDSEFEGNEGTFGGAIWTEGAVTCTRTETPSPPRAVFLDSHAEYAGGALTVTGAGSVETHDCPVWNSTLTNVTGQDQVAEHPDIMVAPNVTAWEQASFYLATGADYECLAPTGCTGDVE